MSTPPPKPTVLRVNADGIPAEMKQRNQWVLWRSVCRDGKWTKLPLQVDGKSAKSTDPTTWASFDEVLAVYQRSTLRDGIGFVFSPDDPFTFIDLDNCRDPETGKILPWSAELRAKFKASAPDPVEIIPRMQTFTEVSPSGKGLHIFAAGKLPSGGNKIGGKGSGCPDGIEMYDRGRYAAITGIRLESTPATVNECNGTLDDLHARVFGKPTPKAKPKPRGTATAPTEAAGELPDDDTILAKAGDAENGGKLVALMLGDTSGYSSASEADLALASVLTFWTGPRPDVIERLMRRSGLAREKWDEHKTYLGDTISKALEGKTEFYNWSRKRTHSPITNVVIVDSGGDGDGAPQVEPVPMAAVLAGISAATDKWPRRVGSALFIVEKGKVYWLESPASVFGWFAKTTGIVSWSRVSGAVSKEEVFHTLRRDAIEYRGIETYPHVPRLSEHFYLCEDPPAGDGKAFSDLLDRFCFATPPDRDLAAAAFATPLWGGLPGTRPAIMVTANGRGRGKTKFAISLAELYGGYIDVSPNDEIGTIKTRLLSPEAAEKRVAMLDNVKTSRFSWGELEAMLTTATVSGKRLYVGEGARSNCLTWAITLNGASLSTDMAQRVVEIRLADPQYDPAWEETTRALIEEKREAIFGDIAAMLRGPGKPLPSTTRWATWERDVLAKVAKHPADCLRLLSERRAAADVENEESDILESEFSSRLLRLGYDPECDDVFIPNSVATQWVNQATGERHRTTAVSRLLRQYIEEGRMPRLMPERYGPNRERGFRWVGEHCDAATITKGDLMRRLAQAGQGESTDSTDTSDTSPY